MSVLIDALQPYMLLRIGDFKGKTPRITIADSATAQTASVVVGYSLAMKSINLTFSSADDFLYAMAADCSRLSSASFETIISVRGNNDESHAAWSLIKLYYAAFYAANALIRIFGESHSHFDRTHIKRLKEIASATGSPMPDVEGGAYHCKIQTDMTSLTCERARGARGGLHESFWNIFGGVTVNLSRRMVVSQFDGT